MTETLLTRRLGTAAMVVTVDGAELPLDQVAAVTIRHGRPKAEGAGQPGTASFTTKAATVPQVGQAVTVQLGADGLAAYGAPAGAAPRFSGTVTDAKLAPEPGTAHGRRRTQLAAVSNRAKLGRQYVGDAPWPQELDGARMARLLALATGVTIGAVDTGTVQVLARDVDRQPLLKLAEELAVDAEGLLVELRDGTLTYHDADHRTALAPALTLDARDILWPLEWSQDLAGMVNALTVGYGASEPQATVQVTDDASVAVHGLLEAKVGTKLADLAAAESYANVTVGRRSRPWWDLSALTVELLRHVDGTTQLHPRAAELLQLEAGDLIELTGMASTAPIVLGRVWVEGWTETITATSHRLVLSVTPYGRTGPAARWVDVPAGVTWADLDPALSWLGMASWDPGTGPDGRWAGTPHDLTWADLDPGITWATWPY